MLSGICIKNFKSLKSVDLELKRITVFIGPNGSGKSSIFQALLALKNFIIKNGDVSYSQIFNLGFVDLGDPTQVSHLKDNFPIVIGVKSCVENNTAEYTIEIQQNDQLNVELLLSILVRNKRLDLTLRRTLSLSYTYRSFSTHDFIFNNTIYKLQWDGLLNLENVEPKPSQSLITTLNNAVDILAKSIRNVYLVPYYKLGFIQSQIALQSMDIEPQLVVPEQYVASTISSNSDVEDYITSVTEEVFGRAVRQVSRPNAVELIVRLRRGKTITLVNEGGGLNRLTYLLGAIISVPKGSCLLVEEPETNLHPKAQYTLASYLVELGKVFDKQILISTHSEHLLYGFLDCIRQGSLDLNDFVIYYLNKEDFETKIKRLEIDEKGRVKGGLPGFFEENLSELITALEG
jgi:predicted ATPase